LIFENKAKALWSSSEGLLLLNTVNLIAGNEYPM
jgi:hypothetical protein